MPFNYALPNFFVLSFYQAWLTACKLAALWLTAVLAPSVLCRLPVPTDRRYLPSEDARGFLDGPAGTTAWPPSSMNPADIFTRYIFTRLAALYLVTFLCLITFYPSPPS
jgi:hypothetical protein